MAIKETIRDFIVDNFLFGDDRGLTDESSFITEGIIDSTGIMHLVAFLGERFSVDIDDRELIPENLDSINNVTAFVETKKAQKAARQEAASAGINAYEMGSIEVS